MKFIILALGLIVTATNLRAQKTDYDWLIGIDPLNDPQDSTYGISHVDFNQEPPGIYYDGNITLNFYACDVSICDAEGNLLFYSNCIEIFNAAHEPLNNSQGFNDYPFHDGYLLTGLPLVQGILGFKLENGNNQYCLIHEKIDWEEINGEYDLISVGLFYSIIDMDENGGLGNVIENGIPLIEDTLAAGMLTATRHANGRDWWIITPEYNTNRYYRILLTPQGPQLMDKQEIGEPTINGLGQAVFSPDGSWYVRNNLLGGPADDDYLDIYRFDRCSGLLSEHIRFPYGNGVNAGGGVAISPNNRFLYVSHRNHVYQYDLWATDIQESKDTVSIYDGYLDDGFNPTTFFLAQLAPDGKVYLSCTNGTRWLHIINNPNGQGDACEFAQRGIHLPTVNFTSLPNFPNYRLGPIDSSPCDTLGLDNHPLANWRYDIDTLNPLLVELTDNSFYEPTEWSWDFGDGGASNEMNPVHTFPTSGAYNVCLTVSNQYGSDTLCRQVTVGVTAAGETKKEAFSLRFYPNPAKHELTFEVSSDKDFQGELRIIDFNGKIIKQGLLRTGTNKLSFDLPSGVYFVTLQSKEGVIFRDKVVILR